MKLAVKIRAAEPARRMLTSEAGAAPPYGPSCALGVGRTHTPNRPGGPHNLDAGFTAMTQKGLLPGNLPARPAV
jgi:hypothetical protein